MSGGTSGYVAGIDYLYDFQPEMAPLRIQLALLCAGFAPPRIATACELGFGQGLTVNIHAAAQPVHWYGTDFNPNHVGFARDLAAASGARLQLYQQSFAEFCARPDLPDFDLIAMHGVWTWVGGEDQALIVDFLRRKLRAGGVVYLSYNVQAGFAPLIPLHPLLTRHAAVVGHAGDAPTRRIDTALAFAERVLAVSPAYAGAQPRLPALLRAIRREDRRYLAHEYLSADWKPTSFERVADALGAAQLEYAASPCPDQAPQGLELSAAQRALLAEIPDPSYRELVRDLMVNRTFRIDYWVRGARRLPPQERLERLLEQRVMLVRQPGEVLPTFARALEAAGALHPLLTAVVEALADHRPRRLAEVQVAIASRGFTAPHLCDAISALANLGAVVALQDEPAAQAARPRTDKLNALLCARALRGADVRALASPVTGTGFDAAGGRVALFFLDGVARGLREARELGAQALQVFGSLGIGLFRDGQRIESAQESLELLTGQAQYFLDRQLPALRAMQIS
jgi:hypothetical protein